MSSWGRVDSSFSPVLGERGWCVRERVRGGVMQRMAPAAKRQGQNPLSVKGQREAESVDANGERKQRSHVSGVLTWDMCVRQQTAKLNKRGRRA